MRTTALVLAAGKGTRFGSDKMAVTIGGSRPWEIVAARLSPLVKNVIVVGQDIPGGDTRRASVLCGLAHVKTDRVIIAEGARFLVSASEYENAIRAEGRAVAFGSPAVNTSVLKLDDTYAPVPRAQAIEVHTPQVFDTAFLRWALNRHGHLSDGDEWTLIATLNQWHCSLLPGSWRTAMKLTNPHDLEVMEALQDAQNYRHWRRKRYSASADHPALGAEISIDRESRRAVE